MGKLKKKKRFKKVVEYKDFDVIFYWLISLNWVFFPVLVMWKGDNITKLLGSVFVIISGSYFLFSTNTERKRVLRLPKRKVYFEEI